MKFSLIMGSFNPNLNLLNRAIHSADGLFDECIFVDDGSKDDIAIQMMQMQYKNIKHEMNQGFWAAKNTAIESATGDIICTLDDDDYFDTEGVKDLKMSIERYGQDVDIWHFPLREFGNSSGVYGQNFNPKDLTSYNSIPGVSWYRKSVWEELGGFRNVRAEDWNLWLRAYKANKKFKYFDKVVYNFNVRNGSASRNWNVPFEEIKNEVLNTN